MSETDTDNLSRRQFLKAAGATVAGLALGEGLAARKVEAATEELKPGKKAPETWGGAGIFDVMAVYVVDPEFSGQAVILLRRDEHNQENNIAVTLVDGRKKDGTIVKGMNVTEGGHVYSSKDKLNITLGGGSGGAQLHYDPDRKTLNFDLNGFLVYDTKGERVDLRTEVRVDLDRSRILHGYDSSYLQYYMRAGTTEKGGSGTSSLMVAHASVRDIPTAQIDQKVQSLTDFWFPILPTVAVSKDGNYLYVVQLDSANPGKLTAFAWNGRRRDMDVETDVTVKRDSDPSGENTYPVPKKININFKGKDRKIVARIAPTDKFGFLVEFPNPITGDEVKANIALAYLNAFIGDRPLNLMIQTAAIPEI